MQVKSKLADFFEKQTSGSYEKYIGLVNGRGKVAETEWNKKQVEFTKHWVYK